MKCIRIVATLCMVLLTGYLSAQRSGKSSDVYVDKNGVIRWSKNNAEIQGFGVNYTAPFAHGYSTAKNVV